MISQKFSVILSNVGSCCDRFLSTGYSRDFSIEEMFDRVASIENVKGVELVAGWHIRRDNVKEIKSHLDRTGLKLVSIIPDHFGSMEWGRGAFISNEASVRNKAVKHTAEMMDIASELSCDLINLWPGQDGYDYYFQSDYIKERTLFEECIKECCRYRKDIRIAVEYKMKEPRNRSYPSNVYSTLLMVNEVGEDNCGITIDYGHALVAYENPSESVAVLKKYGNKLFHIHMNDNYGYWDDDMIAGSIHTIPYIEFFYWLNETGYDGWLSMDQYPYREDGVEAVDESIKWLTELAGICDKLDINKIKANLKNHDAAASSRMLRKSLFN